MGVYMWQSPDGWFIGLLCVKTFVQSTTSAVFVRLQWHWNTRPIKKVSICETKTFCVISVCRMFSLCPCGVFSKLFAVIALGLNFPFSQKPLKLWISCCFFFHLWSRGVIYIIIDVNRTELNVDRLIKYLF